MNKYNNYALITGAGGLLGKYHAEALMEIGIKIIFTDINLKSLTNLKKDLNKKFKNNSILIKKLNVTSEKSIKDLIKKLNKDKIKIKFIINNAAIDFKFKKKKDFLPLGRLENYDIKQWNNEIKVGLTGPMLMAKHFGKSMLKNKTKGLIINIGSDLSKIAPNQNIYKVKNIAKNHQPVKPVTYSIIKHGILGLTKYLSTYWADQGIRCNCLSPGPIDQGQNKSFLNKVRKQVPISRLARPDEFKEAIKFLCSEKASFLNGHNLIIDGGKSVW